MARCGSLRRFSRSCPVQLIVQRLWSDLAVRAVPGSAAAGARLLDLVAAAKARLAVPAVDAELGLHPPRGAVGVAVVAQRGALPRDAAPERPLDPTHERLQLFRLEVACRAQRMEAGPPERLVGIDVSDAGEHALVEDDGLEGRSAA